MILWRELGRQGAPPQPPKPAKRKRPFNRGALLVMLRTAGYHNDSAGYTRLTIENRISREKARAEWNRGAEMKKAGVPCTCSSCKPIT